jgi:putative endopeptidase
MTFAKTLLAAASLSVIAISSPAFAQEKAAAEKQNGPQLGTFGFDTSGMDKSVDPGDDFYTYASGKWAERTEIPADKSNYGMFTALDDLSKERVRSVLDAQKDVKGSKVGDTYASYIDEATVEKLGMKPVQPWIAKIRGVKSKAAFEKLLPIAARNGVGSLFGGYVGQDDKNPESYIFQIYPSGLGMPDRDMYLVENEKFAAIRTAYKVYLAKMLTLAGEKDADSRAGAIFDMEKKIAEVHWTREDASDATKTYNKMTLAQLDSISPGLNLVPRSRS